MGLGIGRVFSSFFLLHEAEQEENEKKGERRMRKRFIHQCMRKPDFGTIHGAISGGFEYGEIICVFGVEEEGLD